MTENVAVREPEAAEDRPTEDRPSQQPIPAADRAGQSAPAGDRPETAREAVTKAEAETARGAATTAEAQIAAGREAEAAASLFPADQASGYRSRWQEIQTGFVDEPRAAVQEADGLVAEVMRQLARTFAGERHQLEAQWSEGEEISTEDLRLALRRYRSFFDRLLSV